MSYISSQAAFTCLQTNRAVCYDVTISLNMNFIFNYFVVGILSGVRKLWIIGDDYVASTIRKSFLKNERNFFMKTNFEIEVFGSNRFNDSNQNVLSRLQIAMAKTVNDNHILPEFIVIVLENDLIEYLGYKDAGVASMYGPWLEWLCEQVSLLITKKFDKLPTKNKFDDPPQVYWCGAVTHHDFSDQEKEVRNKFNKCLETNVKKYESMRMIRFKEKWNHEEPFLVSNDAVSITGQLIYWQSVDVAVAFNVEKHRQFLVCEKYRLLQLKRHMEEEGNSYSRKTMKYGSRAATNESGDSRDVLLHTKDGMQHFFECNKHVDHYHWHKHSVKLPKPKNFI